MFWKVLWTDNTEIILFQSHAMTKVLRKKGSAFDPKNTNFPVKHGAGNILDWACIDTSRTGSFIFIDVIHDGNSRRNSEDYRNIFFCQFTEKCIQTHREEVYLSNHTADTTKGYIS